MSLTSTDLVMIPLMPQGVEHRMQVQCCSAYESVMIPLMPQGVEHEAHLVTMQLKAGDDSIDAARR